MSKTYLLIIAAASLALIAYLAITQQAKADHIPFILGTESEALVAVCMNGYSLAKFTTDVQTMTNLNKQPIRTAAKESGCTFGTYRVTPQEYLCLFTRAVRNPMNFTIAKGMIDTNVRYVMANRSPSGEGALPMCTTEFLQGLPPLTQK